MSALYFIYLYSYAFLPHKVPAFNICTKCVGNPDMIHDRTPGCHPVSWTWIRPQVPNFTTVRSFDSQATWVFAMLGLSFEMVSMGVCTTSHWQTFGRLVQELNISTTETVNKHTKYIQYNAFFTSAPPYM